MPMRQLVRGRAMSVCRILVVAKSTNMALLSMESPISGFSLSLFDPWESILVLMTIWGCGVYWWMTSGECGWCIGWRRCFIMLWV